MNSKKLIIAFMTVSVFALIVSALAVFTVARTYSQSLITEEQTTPPATETISKPEESEALPTVNDHPETEEISETAPVTEAPETTKTSGETSAPRSLFSLTLSGGRLIITSPEGKKVYERIIDESDIRQKDKELLLEGIEFEDLEGAMSAVYDLVS